MGQRLVNCELVDDALEEPLVGVALAEEPIRRAIS